MTGTQSVYFSSASYKASSISTSSSSMKYLHIVVIVFAIITLQLKAQDTHTYRLFLKDKGTQAFIQGSALYEQTRSMLSQRALQRRAKVLPTDALISLRDAPLYQPYLDDIRTEGAKILLQLRWQNYVVIDCDSATMVRLQAKPYTQSIQRTSSRFKTQSLSNVESDTPTEGGDIPDVLLMEQCGPFRYGSSYTQHKMLHTDEFHAMGISGKGVLMGLLDNGFRWRWHESTKNADVNAEYDFAFGDSVTANEANDVPNQDIHGTAVFSTVCGWEPDSLIGVAPFASFLLSKTEDMRFEKRIEEDNYAAGLEWMESLGADLSTASIGYDVMDSTEMDYPFSEFDGKTTLSSQAINRAVSLGMVCLSAAGNAGGVEKTIMTPADADSVLTVGAYADDSLRVAGFTSKGPNAAGHQKPEIAALGINVRGMSFESTTAISKHVGTSFATPLAAGAVALLINAFPEIKPYEVRRLLQNNATQSAVPDNAVGYGLPNFMQAAENYGIVISPLSTYPGKNSQYFVVYIRSAYAVQSVSLFVSGDSGAFKEYALQPSSVAHQYYVRVPIEPGIKLLWYYLSVRDEQRERRAPLNLSKYYNIRVGESTYHCGIAPEELPTSIDDERSSVALIPRALPYGTPAINLLLDAPDTRISIHDAVGREVFSGSYSQSSVFVPIAHLMQGIYTLSIVGAKASSQPLYTTFLLY